MFQMLPEHGFPTTDCFKRQLFILEVEVRWPTARRKFSRALPFGSWGPNRENRAQARSAETGKGGRRKAEEDE